MFTYLWHHPRMLQKKKAAHDDGTANLTSLSIVVPHGAAHKGNQIQATKSGHHPEEAIQMPLV
jgi:hypothetical protein